MHSQNVYTEARAILQKNIQQFKIALLQMPHLPIMYLPKYPVFFTQQKDLFDYLLKHKILISSFSYPKPTDSPITRIVLSALHTEGDIEYLIEKLK